MKGDFLDLLLLQNSHLIRQELSSKIYFVFTFFFQHQDIDQKGRHLITLGDEKMGKIYIALSLTTNDIDQIHPYGFVVAQTSLASH